MLTEPSRDLLRRMAFSEHQHADHSVEQAIVSRLLCLPPNLGTQERRRLVAYVPSLNNSGHGCLRLIGFVPN
jgi:hypothetical protein